MRIDGGIVESAYPSQLTMANFMTADATLGAVTAWTTLGAYTVPDGVAIKLGVGALEGQDNAQGRLYYDIIDDTAGDVTPEDGLIRLVAVNPTATKHAILYQGSTAKGRSATADDRTGQIPLAERGPWIPQFCQVQLQMRPNAAGDVVQWDFSTLLMDIMVADFRPA